MTNTRKIQALAVALAAIFCNSAHVQADAGKARLTSAQSDKARLATALEQGKRQAAFCFNCHGEKGISAPPEVPNLAGQPAVYLLDQIRKFATGERRDAFMQGLTAALKDDEKVNIALYFAAQPIQPGGSPPAGNAEQGKRLYEQSCSTNCHGTNGRGTDLMPTVAGQKHVYLVKSLKRYRDKTGERRHKEMSEAAARLSDADLDHVAAYLGTMK